MSSQISLVVITGANGYLGSHTVKAALDSGVADVVRAVVRSESSAAGLREIFANELKSGKAEIAFVPDILVEGAYTEAVRGADAVIHIASPLAPPNLTDVEQQLLRPAKQGALNLLEAAAVTPTVKKVVLTSSIVAAIDRSHFDRAIDNDSWNPVTEEQAKEATNGSVAYAASKTLAEQAAWSFMKTRKPSFALTALNPTINIGPTLQAAPVDSTTSSYIWKAAQGETTLGQAVGYVDVRDVARAHVIALTSRKSDGKRYILVAGQTTCKEIAEATIKAFPNGKWTVPTDEGSPPVPIKIDVSDLGLTFRPVLESALDIVRAELARTSES